MGANSPKHERKGCFFPYEFLGLVEFFFCDGGHVTGHVYSDGAGRAARHQILFSRNRSYILIEECSRRTNLDAGTAKPAAGILEGWRYGSHHHGSVLKHIV